MGCAKGTILGTTSAKFRTYFWKH